jgi:ketosteroid isomerase-like protein
MEVRWKGAVATTGEGFTAGHELDARMACFLKFADGKIVRQRTYACFEPWSTKAERMLTLDERVAQAGQSTKAPLHVPGPSPIGPSGSNFDIARNYLEALGSRADAEIVGGFFAADAVQDEFPNRFRPDGAHRDLLDMKLERSRGLVLMASESYELLGATGGGAQVALEVAWSGVVGEGMGLFTAGQKLEARRGIFLKFRDGLIVTQRNYDCAL